MKPAKNKLTDLPPLVNRIQISQSKSKIANAAVAIFLVSWIIFYLLLRAVEIRPTGYISLLAGIAIAIYYTVIKLKGPCQLMIDAQGVTSPLTGHILMRDIGGISIIRNQRSATTYNLALFIPKHEKYLDRFSNPFSFLRKAIFKKRKTVSIPFTTDQRGAIQVFETLTRFRKQVDLLFMTGYQGDYAPQLLAVEKLSEYGSNTDKTSTQREEFARIVELMKRLSGGWSSMDTLVDSEKRLEIERLRLLQGDFMMHTHQRATSELLAMEAQNASYQIVEKIEQINKDGMADFSATNDGRLLSRLEKEIGEVAQARIKQARWLMIIATAALIISLMLKLFSAWHKFH